MSTNAQVDSVNSAGNLQEDDQDRRIAVVRKIGDFLLRLLQMVLATEAGMGIYRLLSRTILARTGYAALTALYPIIGYLAMELSMVVATTALVRFWHKATWRYSLQMSAVMLAPVATLTMLALDHVIPVNILYSFSDPGTYAAMIVFMFVRSRSQARSINGVRAQAS